MPVVTPPFDETKLEKLWANIALLEFRRQLTDAISVEKMVDGVADEYEDETGIDTAGSTNEAYDATNDLYQPSADSFTKLLLHCNGSDLSTTFTDSALGKTVTANGDAKLKTDQKKFGTASGYFDGTGDFLSIASGDADLNFADGDFTVEFWARPAAAAYIYWGKGSDVNNRWDINPGLFYIAVGGVVKASYTYGGASWTSDEWHHFAWVRSGTSLKFFIDGVEQTATATAQAIGSNNIDLASAFAIGRRLWNADRDYTGYIDEVRISKGVARYSSDFSVETAEFPVRLNMTLKSAAATAAAQANKGRIFLFEEDVDAITVNTDLLAYVSRDNGTTWTQVTLANLGAYDTGKNILGGIAEISGQPAGTSMKYKIESANNKNFKLHGTGLLWQ